MILIIFHHFSSFLIGFPVLSRASKRVYEVYVLARDPVACRILQEVIERSSSREAVEVVNELQGHVWELAMCPHGNYVVQKVVSHLSVSSSHFAAWKERS